MVEHKVSFTDEELAKLLTKKGVFAKAAHGIHHPPGPNPDVSVRINAGTAGDEGDPRGGFPATVTISWETEL